MAIEEKGFYEAGFLLSPLVPAEQLAATVDSEVRQALIQAGAMPESETMPRFIRLTYPIKKRLGHEYKVFKDAYFGAIKFSAESGQIEKIDASLKKSAALIRFLLIGYPRFPVNRPQPRPVSPTRGEPRPGRGQLKEATPADIQNIDQEIESLLSTSDVK